MSADIAGDNDANGVHLNAETSTKLVRSTELRREPAQYIQEGSGKGTVPHFTSATAGEVSVTTSGHEQQRPYLSQSRTLTSRQKAWLSRRRPVRRSSPISVGSSYDSDDSTADPPDAATARKQFEHALKSRLISAAFDILEHHFEQIATGSWFWLHELADLGYSHQEMAELLIEKEGEKPWIAFAPWELDDLFPDQDFHTPECAHADRGRQMLEPKGLTGLRASEHPLPSRTKTSRIASSSSPGGGWEITTNEDPMILPGAVPSLVQVNRITLRRTVASLCGMAGVRPVANQPLLHEWEIDFANKPYPVVKCSGVAKLQTVSEAVSRLCTAISKVQQSGGCCERFTFLCKTRHHETLVLRSIAVKQVAAFGVALRRANGNIASAEARVAACSILELFPDFEGVGRAFSAAEHVVCLAAQFLNAAFVSYMQGHCGCLEFFFLEYEVLGMTLWGAGQSNEHSIRVSPEKLTCLDAMLDGQNVIAFQITSAYGHDVIAPATTSSSRYDVLASADDLIDTWGPGNMILQQRNSNEPDAVAGLVLRGGIIHERRESHHHWTPLAEFTESTFAGQWDRCQMIRIGTQIDVNKHCTAKESDHLEAFEGLWKPLGTAQAYWKHQERQIGLQGGQYVTMVYNSTWDKVPGVRLKTQLIQNLGKKLEYFAFLNACCGLQVSACSGLARRITMRELLSDLLPTFVLRQASASTFWHKLIAEFDIIGNLASENFTPCREMFTRMSEQNSQCFDGFWHLALELVKSLELTGLQPAGDEFFLGFLPTEPTEYLRRVSITTKGNNLWLKILRDSESSATFAYLTPKCLELGGKGCRKATLTQENRVHFLQTDVQRQLDGLSPKGTSSANWQLKDKETHFFRAKDDNKDVVLSASVVRSAAFSEPRLFVKESLIPLHIIKRMFRRQDQQYLQEKLTSMPGDQRAFITSSLEAGPWFT